MAYFVIPVTIELHFERDTIEEAKERFYIWRKFIMAALHGRLIEVGVRRISISPVREVTEVDSAWLENRALRPKFRQEWDYEDRQVPVTPTSKYSPLWLHRVAKGPKLPPSS